jgi:hypothetical protein
MKSRRFIILKPPPDFTWFSGYQSIYPRLPSPYLDLFNAARPANRGNTVGAGALAGSGAGPAHSLTAYGQIPAAQLVRPGSCTGAIAATITHESPGLGVLPASCPRVSMQAVYRTDSKAATR